MGEVAGLLTMLVNMEDLQAGFQIMRLSLSSRLMFLLRIFHRIILWISVLRTMSSRVGSSLQDLWRGGGRRQGGAGEVRGGGE